MHHHSRGTTDRGIGYTVHRGESGGPVIVLANSLGTTKDSWREVLEQASAAVTLVTYDLRGHGRSPSTEPFTFDDMVADAVDVIGSTPAESVHWCGISLGAMIGVALAGRYPEKLGSLTAVSSPASQENPQFWLDRAAQVTTTGMSVATNGVDGRWFSPQFIDRRPERVREVVGALADLDPAGYAATCIAMAAADVRADAAQIVCPTEYIVGTADLAVPPAHSSMLAEATVHSVLTRLDGVGHLATIEAATEVVDILERKVIQQ